VDQTLAFLDVVPTRVRSVQKEGALDDLDLVCVHRDGKIRRVSGDLEEELWNCDPILPISDGSSESTVPPTVRAAFMMDFDVARNSVLKSREDLLASMDSGGEFQDSNDYSVLAVVSGFRNVEKDQSKDLVVDFFAVPWSHTPKTPLSTSGRNLLHLMTKTLPQPPQPAPDILQAAHFKFHPPSGILYLVAEGTLLAYDLRDHIPRISFKLSIDVRNIDSFLRVSDSSVVASTVKGVTVYNMQYQSVQATLAPNDLLPKLSKKQRGTTLPLRLVSYYPKRNLAVALHGQLLVGIQLSMAGTKRDTTGLLINSIGRGLPVANTTEGARLSPLRKQGSDFMLVSTRDDLEWKTRRAKLDSYVSSQNTSKFEEYMAVELCRRSGTQRQKRKRQDPDSEELGMNSGAVENTPKPKDSNKPHDSDLHLPCRTDQVDPETLLYLLSKIFSLKRPSDSSASPEQVVISFFPPRLFRWLATTGRLAGFSIELALRKQSAELALWDLHHGSLLRAITDFDPSLNWLNVILQESSSFSTDELVLTMRGLLEYPAQPSEVERPKLLTNGSHDTADTPGPPAAPAESLLPKSKPRLEIPRSPTLLNVTTALNLILSGLHAHHPGQAVTKSLRKHLTRTQTFTILHHLRLCLASGGWTSRFADHHSMEAPHPSDTNDPPALGLDAIATLLNCAIDAIGPSGFLSSISPRFTHHPSSSPADPNDMEPDVFPEGEAEKEEEQEEEEEELIPFMKAEISAALAGIEESSYLRGIVREFLRYSLSSQSSTFLPQITTTPSRDPVSALQPTPSIIKQGGAEIHTFTSSRPDERAIDGEKGLLPLSLKAYDSGKDLKTRLTSKSGERVQRSKREISRLKSMRVGEYSFERIVI
jgi:hypothetical protein